MQELATDAAVLRATIRVDSSRLDSIRAATLESVARALPEAGLGPALPRRIVQVGSAEHPIGSDAHAEVEESDHG